MLRQSSETLAGRIAYLELSPLDVLEIPREQEQTLWIRGGFPRSFLAKTDAGSATWRENFITTYLERDIPQLGPRIPAETLRRFWTMLAHSQGGPLNAAQLGRSLAVDGKTIAKYLDLMVDLLLELSAGELWAIEIKRNLSPKLEKGFRIAQTDIKPTRSFLVYPGEDRYPKSGGTEVIGLHDMADELSTL